MYTNLPTSEGYIFRILQHFATKICSFSNFDNFFPKISFVIPRLKIFLKRKNFAQKFKCYISSSKLAFSECNGWYLTAIAFTVLMLHEVKQDIDYSTHAQQNEIYLFYTSKMLWKNSVLLLCDFIRDLHSNSAHTRTNEISSFIMNCCL